MLVGAWKQIAERVHLTLAEGRSEVSLQLWPPSLGRLQVRLTLEDGHVAVRMDATTAQAKELIQANLPALRTAFQDQGLPIAGLFVSVGQGGGSAFETMNHRPRASGSLATRREPPGRVEVNVAAAPPLWGQPPSLIDYRV